MLSSSRNLLSIACLLASGAAVVDGLAAPSPNNVAKQRIASDAAAPSSRRAFLSSSAAATAFLATMSQPQAAAARYVLNEDTGEYDEVQDKDWQTTWGERLDKAKSMSTEEVFLAAQGAGNQELRVGEESEASKKRRALAGCRNDGLRAKAGIKDAKECTARVLANDYQFMIDAM